jgi:hypothetical protein
LAEFPPAVGKVEFQAVATKDKEEIRTRFGPFIHDLHSFLNHTSCLRNIQRVRRALNPNIRERLAFRDFSTEPEHWYTHHAGGRNEAQFNIGLFPEYLRVGLGFEIAAGTHGNPEAVQAVNGAFKSIVRQHRQAFDRFVEKNKLEVEWHPKDRPNLEYVPTRGAVKWLLRPKASEWIFIGRLLYRGDDAQILEDPSQLKEVMESVFGGLKPLWEQAQKQAQRPE